MEEKVIINSSCHEIPNVKSVYWIWHDNFISIEKVRREELWRINKLNLATDIVPKLFNVDVTEWQWDEVGSRVGNGGVLTKQLKGFVPKLNEWAESYFNEMFRRPITVFIEDFEDVVYLFGGEKCRATFSFNKSISGRNGYDIIITTLSDESSLIVNDTDYFPAPPDSELVCDPVTINLDGTDILTAAAGSTVSVNLEDTDENPVVPNDLIIVGNNIKIVLDAPTSPSYNLDLVDRFGNAFPTAIVDSNKSYDLRTLEPFDFADMFLALLNSPSSTIQNAILDYVEDMNAAGLWQDIYTCHPFVNANANDHALNLKYPFRKSSANYGYFVGSPTHNSNGMTTAGSQAMVIPTNPDTFANGGDRYALSVYSRTNVNQGSTLACDFGGSPDSSQATITRIWIRSNNNQIGSMGGHGDVYFNNAYTGRSDGLFSTYLGGATDGLARNGINLTGGSNYKSPAQQSRLTSLAVGAQMTANGPIWYSNRNFCYASTQKAWSLAQEVDHYTIVQALQTALSRQV